MAKKPHTSMAYGEEDVMTTMMVGEEDPMTTMALGEEDPIYTTLAVGEEDGTGAVSIDDSAFGAF